MLQCYKITMLQSYNVTKLQCYKVTKLQCYKVTMLRSYNVKNYKKNLKNEFILGFMYWNYKVATVTV